MERDTRKPYGVLDICSIQSWVMVTQAYMCVKKLSIRLRLTLGVQLFICLTLLQKVTIFRIKCKVKSYYFSSKVHFSLNPKLHSKKKQCSHGICRDFKRHEGIFGMMKIFYILIIEQLYRCIGKEMETYSTILAWEIAQKRSLAGYSPWDCKNWTQPGN